MHNNLSFKEISRLLADSGANKVKLAVSDIDGILRGKFISMDKFRAVAEKGFGFCDVIFGWDAADVAYDNSSVTGWHTGYPDATAIIDFNSYRNVPWEQDVPFFLADFGDANGDGYVDAVEAGADNGG